jgi:small subunit ribosomal protein S1
MSTESTEKKKPAEPAAEPKKAAAKPAPAKPAAAPRADSSGGGERSHGGGGRGRGSTAGTGRGSRTGASSDRRGGGRGGRSGERPRDTAHPPAKHRVVFSSEPESMSADLVTDAALPVQIEFHDFDEDHEYTPEEFQQLSELYKGSFREIIEGQITKGKVVRISKTEVIMDIGYKSEGIINIDEFGENLTVKVGDEFDVLLENLEDQDGRIILSKKRADFMKVWEQIKDIYEKGAAVEGHTVRRIKGGLVVNVLGIEAFLPGSQIDIKQIRDFDEHVGKDYKFKIIKVNKLRKNIVVSRRTVLEEERLTKREDMVKTLKKGDVVDGTVKNITDYGVFIDLGGLDGLLHITDMSWSRVNHPSEMVALGDPIKVKVLDFDAEMKRISLGLKQLTRYPWDDIEKNYPKGSKIRGKVVNLADYGAFVELKEGVEGLIHISEMSWSSHVKHPSQILQVGDMVEAVVLNVDKENERISLGLKQKQEDPWQNVEEKFPVGAKVTGRVRNITNFGAFVELEDGIDGLVHISDMSWTKKIRHPSEIMKKNDPLEVKILSVDKAARRISLGHKQILSDPWDELELKYKIGSLVKGRILRVLDRGAIVELPDGVDGFLPVSQMATPDVANAAEAFKKGDEIPLAIKHFDKKERKIILSILGYFEGKEQQEIEEHLKKNPIKSITFGELIKGDFGKKELEKLLASQEIQRRENPDGPDQTGE